jgi:hypothetical protein
LPGSKTAMAAPEGMAERLGLEVNPGASELYVSIPMLEFEHLHAEIKHLRAGIERVHSLVSFGFFQDAKDSLEALLSGSDRA